MPIDPTRAVACAATLFSATYAAFPQHAPPDAATASGVVFHDVNRDGERQADEPGIAGVAVSDGRDVVLTDARGGWSMPAEDHDHFFVIKPRGYQVPLNEHHVPRFSYAHKPDGSPDEGFAFPGVAPTGDLPASIDFPLTPNAEPERFSIIAFGDPQPYGLDQIDHYRRDVIDPVVGKHDVAFGVSLGDLVGDDLSLYEPLNQAQALFGVPWYNVYGNHDMNLMSGATDATRDDPDAWADETFERVFGPPDYAFQYGRVHFIVLDNVIWQGFDGFRDDGPYPSWPDGKKPSSRNYRGGLRDHQFEFLANYLRVVPKRDLVVLMFHIPIEMDGDGVHRIPESSRLFKALSSHPHSFSMSGHTHFQRHWLFGHEHGFEPLGENQHSHGSPGQAVHHHLNAVTASGSWFNGTKDETGTPHTQMRDGAPNGYTLVHFEGNNYETEFVPARRDRDDQMAISLLDADDLAVLKANAEAEPFNRGDGPLPTEPDLSPVVVAGEGVTRLVVNVFNGAPVDAVRYRVVPGPATGLNPLPWRTMAFRPQVDPQYVAMHAREAKLPADLRVGWGMPNPQVSHHMWQDEFGNALPIGTHLIEVHHTDLYGNEIVNRRSFRAVRLTD